MKAAYVSGPKQFEVRQVNDPQPDGNRPIIQIVKTGICGSDLSNWKMGTIECVMGHEFIGKILDPGTAKGFKPGDRVTAMPIVYCGECKVCQSGNQHLCPHVWVENATGICMDGTYAEQYLGFPQSLYKIPDHVSDNAATMIEPLAVAIHGSRNLDIRFGEKVLIIGGGVIGQLCAEVAHKAGASYMAMSEVNTARAEAAKKLVALDAVFDASDPDFIAKALEASGGGFDAIYECSGFESGIDASFALVRGGGRIVMVGANWAQVKITPMNILAHECVITGALGYAIQDFDDAYDMVVNGKIDVDKFIDREMPLDDIQKAFEILIDKTSPVIKIVLDIG